MKRWHVFFVGSTLVAASVFTVRHTAVAQEPPANPWFSSQLAVERAPDTAPPKLTPYNAPCEDTTSATFTPGSWGSFENGTMTECVHKAEYGFMSFHRLKLNGTEAAYELRDENSAFADLYPIAYTNSGFRLLQSGGASYTHHLYIYDDIPSNLKVNKFLSIGRPARYQLTHSSTDEANVITDSNGAKVRIYAETLGYSSGGRFMVADSGAVQNLINTQTKKARQFGQPTYSYAGTSPSTKLIVDATGSKVVVIDNERRTQRLYNMENCTQDPVVPTKENCQSIDLTPVLAQTLGSYKAYGTMKFLSKNTLEVFSSEIINEKLVYKRYFVHPENSEANSFEYLALGDSFTSGEGVYNYKYPTDTPDNRCHLSYDSYPYLIKQQLGLTTAESVACSGAKMQDVWSANEREYNKDRRQSKGKIEDNFDNEIRDNFQVGYRIQNQFIKDYSPKIITTSIGGNDIGFGSKIRTCVFQPGNCYDSSKEKAGIFQEIRGQFGNLVNTYQKLKESDESARIYIIGYPEVAAPAKDSCGANVHLSTDEIILSNHIVTDLNATIKAAAEKVGLRYVDVSDVFVGHRLCEAPNWDLAMNGLTAGNDAVPIFGYPIGKESFHPNSYGHELYRKKILLETNNLTEGMPLPDTSISETSITSSLDPVYSYDSTISTARYSPSISDDVMQPGTTIHTAFSTDGIYLNQGDSFTVELHSTPEVVGEATADSLNKLSLDVTIPGETPPGLHTLHVFVADVEGKKFDFYKDIFVIQEGDRDGDGILDEQDLCSFVAPANIDVDKDGVDDSCDGFIAKAPVVDPDPGGDTSGGPKDPPGGDATPSVPSVFLTFKNILKSVVQNIIHGIKSVVRVVSYKIIIIKTNLRKLFLRR